MGLRCNRANAGPDPVERTDLPTDIMLVHRWRHLPDPALVKWSIRVNAGSSYWFRLRGEDEDGWVHMSPELVTSDFQGTEIQHRVCLEIRTLPRDDREARFVIRAVAPDDEVREYPSITVNHR